MSFAHWRLTKNEPAHIVTNNKGCGGMSLSGTTIQKESKEDLVKVGDVALTEAERVERLVAKLRKNPDKWGWEITSIVYGHGKVVIQCRTPKGNGAQFVGRLGND